MNDEENEQEQQEQNSLEKKIIDTGKDAARQGTKIATKKITAKVAVAIAPYAIPIIAGILVAILAFTFLASIFLTVQDAMNEKASNINDNIKLAVKITDDGIVVNPKQLLQNIDDQLETLGLSKESLHLGNERQADAYLYKYMVASLSTQLPYIKESKVKKIKDIASYVSPITYILNSLDQDQEVQGIVKIKRCTAGSSSPTELKYLPYGKSSTEDSSTEDSSTDDSSTEENNEQVIVESTTEESKKKTFSQLIEEDDSEALNYFSIDENWMLCVAKYQEVTVSGASGEHTYTIDEVKIPYQTMLQNYSVPFSFFLTLQQMTRKPRICISSS